MKRQGLAQLSNTELVSSTVLVLVVADFLVVRALSAKCCFPPVSAVIVPQNCFYLPSFVIPGLQNGALLFSSIFIVSRFICAVFVNTELLAENKENYSWSFLGICLAVNALCHV